MAQLTVSDLRGQGPRLGIRLAAGPADERAVTRVDVVALDRLGTVPRGTLAVVPAEHNPPPYRVDVALRHASARQLAGIVFTSDHPLPQTAAAIADRGGVPVFAAPGANPADLAMAIDRWLCGGAAEAMRRAAAAIERATEAAADPDAELAGIIAAASVTLGTPLELVIDPTVPWSASDAVCVADVPIGRLVASDPDAAASVAVPAIASLLSRAEQRRVRDRFAPAQSRADLIVELVLAEPSRVAGFAGPAARLGFPLHLSHVAAWLTPTKLSEPDARAPRGIQPALELFALQLLDGRTEMWHAAFVQDHLLLVSTEEDGAGDHQRRLWDVAVRVQAHARTLTDPEWAFTLGIGSPRAGAAGLRTSAAEARIAAESAIAAGRPGSVEFADITGLRRVLLDLYASPISRGLLHDLLQPLDELGPERSQTAVRTLLAYLAHGNSLDKAARELHLHRNGISYRLKQVREALRLDLDDPDTRLALELACRVRLLGVSRH
ncbi:PucR family transcriptional regulator [Dactylosporangium sp. CA-092794]|uniref:PucR family transcriptional regulator n=1 Tax=Dactylosporangium sp. CA-092794 TaxID=3239929 RepID=UPI003D8F8053